MNFLDKIVIDCNRICPRRLVKKIPAFKLSQLRWSLFSPPKVQVGQINLTKKLKTKLIIR